MVNKKENETENEPKSEEVSKTSIKIDEPTLEVDQAPRENSDSGGDEKEQLSSLDILWRHAFTELDEWAAHADFRDEVFLKEAMHYVDSLKRNQGNIKMIAEQFNKEFVEWEKAAREEFLMSTTSLQHFFPHRSYEEINEQMDKIQTRTMSILSTPFEAITKNQAMDKYFEFINQYISLRKKGRLQYLKTIKHAADLVYENQKGFVNLFSKQIKTLMFPFNKYLEKTEELTKS